MQKTKIISYGAGTNSTAMLVGLHERGERAKGFVRPVRQSYRHTKCGAVTRMGLALAETYARDPKFYGGTFCVGCGTHFPVAEFTWEPDGSVVGS